MLLCRPQRHLASRNYQQCWRVNPSRRGRISRPLGLRAPLVAMLRQPRANSFFDFICGSITDISRLDALDEHAEMFGDQFKVASSDGWRDFLDRAILMHDLPLRQLLPSLNHELRQAGRLHAPLSLFLLRELLQPTTNLCVSCQSRGRVPDRVRHHVIRAVYGPAPTKYFCTSGTADTLCPAFGQKRPLRNVKSI